MKNNLEEQLTSLEKQVAVLRRKIDVLIDLVAGRDPGVSVECLHMPVSEVVFKTTTCPGSGRVHQRYANGGVSVYCERCCP